MGKVENMVLFISTALLLCHFGGLLGATPIGYTLGLILNPQNLKTSGWFGVISTALTLATAGGAVIGLYAAQKVSMVLKAAIVSGLFLIGWDLIALWSLLSEVSVALATILIAPMLLVFIISAVEWWK